MTGQWAEVMKFEGKVKLNRWLRDIGGPLGSRWSGLLEASRLKFARTIVWGRFLRIRVTVLYAY